ncbi:hypothetical protein EYF80_030812 [Liparis tanakae]|uniref:Uncharacterized protein n=1 Tax=Liparis tanakae TaxID=230148 RepID=A0A4Z2GZF5_9TELE|nr:hypothetical protein EYF80_030812 [Liparis tanakae]
MAPPQPCPETGGQGVLDRSPAGPRDLLNMIPVWRISSSFAHSLPQAHHSSQNLSHRSTYKLPNITSAYRKVGPVLLHNDPLCKPSSTPKMVAAVKQEGEKRPECSSHPQTHPSPRLPSPLLTLPLCPGSCPGSGAVMGRRSVPPGQAIPSAGGTVGLWRASRPGEQLRGLEAAEAPTVHWEPRCTG